jgi:putative SOS response-associated peptidase YedK
MAEVLPDGTTLVSLAGKLRGVGHASNHCMCERFSFALPRDKTVRRFGVKVPGSLEAQYNIAPGKQVLLIRDDAPDVLQPARWGIGHSANITGRFGRPVTTVDISRLKDQEPSRDILVQRCLIPADGFYLWRPVTKRSRVPYRVTLKWNLPFAIAGVWALETQEENSGTVSFAVLTTESNLLIKPYQSLMPLILPLDEEKGWLTQGISLPDLRSLILPADGVKIFPVSPLVNDKDNNSPSIIQPVQPADQFGNYFLFE